MSSHSLIRDRNSPLRDPRSGLPRELRKELHSPQRRLGLRFFIRRKFYRAGNSMLLLRLFCITSRPVMREVLLRQIGAVRVVLVCSRLRTVAANDT